MVKINKIYTRSGDAGNTHLVGGSVVPKNSLRVTCYGELDELNSVIGIVIAHAKPDALNDLCNSLESIQQRLFDLGAELACPANSDFRGIKVIVKKDIEDLEQKIDQACDGLPELKSFVLPGGHIVNAYLHLARTVCRRFERNLVNLQQQESIGDYVLPYVNRLSDYLFALARRVSADTNTAEVLWKN